MGGEAAPRTTGACSLAAGAMDATIARSEAKNGATNAAQPLAHKSPVHALEDGHGQCGDAGSVECLDISWGQHAPCLLTTAVAPMANADP